MQVGDVYALLLLLLFSGASFAVVRGIGRMAEDAAPPGAPTVTPAPSSSTSEQSSPQRG